MQAYASPHYGLRTFRESCREFGTWYRVTQIAYACVIPYDTAVYTVLITAIMMH